MKSKLLITTFIMGLAALFALQAANAADTKPGTDKQKFSYALGFQFGQSFLRDGLDIDSATLSQAISDALTGKQPQLTIPEMRAAMEDAQKQLMAQRAAMAEKALAAGQSFLDANKKNEGVITRESGLQYKILNSGTGKQPTSESSITAHYKGTLIDGSEFDSSYRRGEPATFGVGQVIKGWQEALPLMKEGDKWQVFIPASLAYGERGQPPSIGPNETLVFDIELIKVN